MEEGIVCLGMRGNVLLAELGMPFSATCACVYCGYTGTTLETWLALVPDHLIPRGKGGETRTENLVAACARCNAFKRDDDPSDGGSNSPPSDESRRQLITIAKKKIEGRYARQEALKDFELMMHALAA